MQLEIIIYNDRLSRNLVPKKAKDPSEARKSVFIFSPFERSNANKEIMWVQGELARVKVSLYNPFFVELKLRNIRIW